MKTALAFSGGKDSWACLWLNKAALADILVIWVNPGKTYPEMLKTIAVAKMLCPNFVEVKVDRAGQNEYHGLPSDVVPVNWTRLGQLHTGAKPVTVQPYINCCYENIGLPLHSYCKRVGVTHLIRGQRNDEAHKSTARNGDIVEGITYLQPIENWTAQQTLDFVAEHMPLPDHFQFKHTSMDCYDCTAYRSESKDRIEYMRRSHPALYAEYRTRADALASSLAEAMT